MISNAVLVFIWLVGLNMATLYVMAALIMLVLGDYGAINLFAWHAIVVMMPAVAVKLSLNKQVCVLSYTAKVVYYIVIWPIIALGASSVAHMLQPSIAFSDIFYLCVTALTTTSTFIADTHAVNGALPIWLGLLTWYGGLLTLVGTLTLMVEWVKHTSTNQNMFWHHDVQVTRRAASVMRRLLTGQSRHYLYICLLYFSLTCFAGFALYPFVTSGDKLAMLVFNLVSTGGFFTIINDSVWPLPDTALLIMMVVLVASCVLPLVIVSMGTKFKFSFDVDHILIWLVPLMAFLLVLFIMSGEGVDFIRPLMVVSGLFSTTGLAMSSSDIANIPVGLTLLLLMVGGYSFSSAGGIKIDRVVLLFTYVRRVLLQSVYPHAYAAKLRERDQARQMNYMNVSTVFVLFVLMWLLSAVWLATRLPFDAAIMLAMAALTNAGDVYQMLASEKGWPLFNQTLSDFGPTLSVLMVLGRIELILALVIIARLIMRLKIY